MHQAIGSLLLTFCSVTASMLLSVYRNIYLHQKTLAALARSQSTCCSQALVSQSLPPSSTPPHTRTAHVSSRSASPASGRAAAPAAPVKPGEPHPAQSQLLGSGRTAASAATAGTSTAYPAQPRGSYADRQLASAAHGHAMAAGHQRHQTAHHESAAPGRQAVVSAAGLRQEHSLQAPGQAGQVCT